MVSDADVSNCRVEWPPAVVRNNMCDEQERSSIATVGRGASRRDAKSFECYWVLHAV
jgi:hypothetical protein